MGGSWRERPGFFPPLFLCFFCLETRTCVAGGFPAFGFPIGGACTILAPLLFERFRSGSGPFLSRKGRLLRVSRQPRGLQEAGTGRLSVQPGLSLSGAGLSMCVMWADLVASLQMFDVMQMQHQC